MRERIMSMRFFAAVFCAIVFLAPVIAPSLDAFGAAPAVAYGQFKSPASTTGENGLLQFRSGNHILGFGPNKAYLAAIDHAFTVEFLDTRGVIPKTDSPVSSQKAGKTLPLSRVTYENLWNGITLFYKPAKNGIMESVYHVAPKADVSRIKLKYNSSVELRENGTLKIVCGRGYMTESAPVAWQNIDGRMMPVNVAFRVEKGEVGFKVGKYDSRYALIIDPSYEWHTFYGSASNDYGSAIAVDLSGNIYITGYSFATWAVGGVQPLNSYSGGADIFVLKLSSQGVYQWHTFYGSSSADDYGNGIATDGDGNVYVTGVSAASWLYNTTSPLHEYTTGGTFGHDIVALKLSGSGDYIWHTFYGSASDDAGASIAVDDNGVYIAGYSEASWNSDSLLGTSPKHSFSGAADIVALKLNSDGECQWHTFFGSTDEDYGNGLALDSDGNVYVAGQSYATWNADSISPKHAHSSSGKDLVVLKLNSSGVHQWHTFFGSSSGIARASAVTADGNGYIYIAGRSTSSWKYTTHDPINLFNSAANSDLFVLKLSGSNAAYQWHTFYGASDFNEGMAIAADSGSNVYVAGYSYAAWDGNLSPYTPKRAYSGDSDMVALKLDSSGAYQWHTFYGSLYADFGQGIALDGSGNLYVVGYSVDSWNGDNGAAPLNNHAGNADIAALKLTLNGVCGPANGQPHTSKPTANLCSSSGGVSIVDGTGPWNWTCYAESGGYADDSCSASLGYVISVEASPAAGGSVNCAPNPVSSGAKSTCSISPNTGYTVKGVSGCGAGSLSGITYITGTVTGECTVKATFMLKSYPLEIKKSGTGKGKVTGAGTYKYGTTATVAAVSDTGSIFSGWSGDCSGKERSTAVSMTGAKTCTATFTMKKYTVTAKSAGTGKGSIVSIPAEISYNYPAKTTGAATFNYGAKVVLKAKAVTARRASWNGTCKRAGGSESGNGTGTAVCTFSSLSAAKTVTVTFIKGNHVY